MADQQIFLVFGWDYYEFPYDPVRAFESEDAAKAFVERINEYQKTLPPHPTSDVSDEEFDAAQVKIDAWIAAHPARNHHWREGFSIMTIDLEHTHGHLHEKGRETKP